MNSSILMTKRPLTLSKRQAGHLKDCSMPALTRRRAMTRRSQWAGVGQSRREETAECTAVVSVAYAAMGI